MGIVYNGHKTLISISGVTATFEVVSVTPPALQAGGAIDITTMANNNRRTFMGKKLVTMAPISAKIAYDPVMYAQIAPVLGQNRYCSVLFANGDTLNFYAIVDEFTPDEITSDEFPQATLTLIPSNMNTANPPVETLEVFTTGTTTTTTTTTIL